MIFKRAILIVAAISTLIIALGISPATAQTESVPVYEMDSSFAVDWIKLVYDRVWAEGINAPAAARIYAYAGITMYESLVNGMPDNYTLAGQMIHMPDMPLPEEGTYDWLSVANHSLYRVMSSLLPDSPETTGALTEHYEAVNAERELEKGADMVAFSIVYADDLSDLLLAWIADDHYNDIRELPDYEIPDLGEAGWIPTSEGQLPVEPYWGQIRPFIMAYSSACSVPLNITFSTDPDSTFYQQALEVQLTGQNLTQEQIAIAYHWIDTPGISGTPAGHWMLIGGVVVDRLDLPLDQTAEMYALLGMAVGDAFISGWEAKYRYNLVRPVTYIQRNIRRSWGPLVQTPGFPEYPSGHSLVSGAASTVLTSLFGQVSFVDDTGLERDLQPRSFTSFNAAAYEAAISRMYGGIHYRVGIENGLDQGRCVGQTIVDNVRLNAFRQGE